MVRKAFRDRRAEKMDALKMYGENRATHAAALGILWWERKPTSVFRLVLLRKALKTFVLIKPSEKSGRRIGEWRRAKPRRH